ncbi:hypothetical protein [Humidisolicoccus flavus]|uniref:hypothetical protein n=1 Tax=Humidisolicoccus flavus TaxID=3111414 RepID=UPI003243C9D2
MDTSRRIIGSLVVAAVVFTTSSCLPAPVPGWDKADFTIEEIIQETPDLMTNAHEDTVGICDGKDGCVEGWFTDQAQITRFESNKLAKESTEQLTDFHRWHRIVLDFSKGEATPEERTVAIEIFEGIHSST